MILRAKNPRYHLNSGMIRHLKAITGTPALPYCSFQEASSGATIHAYPMDSHQPSNLCKGKAGNLPIYAVIPNKLPHFRADVNQNF